MLATFLISTTLIHSQMSKDSGALERLDRIKTLTTEKSDRAIKLIRSGKYEEAEIIVYEIESLRKSPESQAAMRAEIALYRQNFDEARKMLRLYFTGRNPGHRSVSGAVTQVAWWFALESIFGEEKYANQAFMQLMKRNSVGNPGGHDYEFNLEKMKTKRVCKVLLFLAAHELGTINLKRCKTYLNMVQTLDPSFKIPPGFKYELDLYKPKPGEEEAMDAHYNSFMVFDPVRLQQKLKPRIIL